MTSFYTTEELLEIGFNKLGDKINYDDIYISRKASIYNPEMISIGNHVRIDDFCILSGKLQIGNYIHIAAYTALYGGDSGIYIKDFSTVSSHSSIYAVSDDYSGETLTNPMLPVKYKNIKSEEVVIEKHVIIGSHSVLLPGCKLNEGVAVGAMTLVNKDLAEWGIYGGVPCKRIKERKKDLLLLEKEVLVKINSR